MCKYSGYITNMPDGYVLQTLPVWPCLTHSIQPLQNYGAQDPLIPPPSHRLFSYKFMPSASSADQFLTIALVNKDLFIWTTNSYMKVCCPPFYSYQVGFGTVGEWKDNDSITAGFYILSHFFVIHRWQIYDAWWSRLVRINHFFLFLSSDFQENSRSKQP